MIKEINKILKELKKVSLKINLDFDKKWFKLVWITKEQEILTEYLSDCRDPIYEKYGHKISERINNLDKFYNSRDYKKCIIRYGGQVISKKSLPGWKFIIEGFENKKLKETLLDFCNKVDKNIDHLDKIAALTETKIKSEKEILIYQILRHEWIHILLEKNEIRSNNWKHNEGLVTYLEFYLDNRLEELDKHIEGEGHDFEKEYLINAILFRNLLENVDDKGKIKKIKDFLKI